MARTSAENRTDIDRLMLFEIIELYDNLAEDACRLDSDLWERLKRLRQQVNFKTVIEVKCEPKRLEATCNP